MDSTVIPKAGNKDSLALGLAQWREAAEQDNDPALAALAEGNALLAAVFGNSPFLSHCAIAERALVRRFMAEGPESVLAVIFEGLAPESVWQEPEAAVMARLRIAKRRVALTVGLADLAGLWSLEQVTAALSRFAEIALGVVVRHLLRQAHEAGSFRLPDPGDPERDSGFILLAMGKLGAYELNYSSDIDLIVFYDPAKVAAADPDGLLRTMVRLTRKLVQMMEERTAEGYVFRTDLRLRPDPGALPLAISVLTAEVYYESAGQNWERAAMIKARPIAGDRAAGAAFLQGLRPFLWRKNLDFAAIQDIHSIKRQINAYRGGASIKVAGHNVKLGRGGIREIEFFAQTQQLIWGGREPALRVPGTCAALAALSEAGHVGAPVTAGLMDSYRFLRQVEHRLQMTLDEQTHSLPADAAGLEALAVFLSYPDQGAMAAELLVHLRRVEEHYAELFEEAPPLAGPGNLVFTGTEDDPDTVKTLQGLGYAQASTVSGLVRNWHRGRYPATRSARARELLTELVPHLIGAFAKTADPDGAFVRFDAFLSRQQAGVALFSLFYNNPSLLDLAAEIMGSAPLLADYLSANPRLLDAVLGARFFDPLPSPTALRQELSATLEGQVHFEETLDTTRRWANDHRFQIGVHSLQGLTTPAESRRAFSDVADVAIQVLHQAVADLLAAAHGLVPGGGMAVLGLGKLGSREMTAGSDLDLIFIYDSPGGLEALSDGPKPLDASVYFTRFGQRLINALTVPTAAGRLYDVDMRLRPSGYSGPLATSLAAFERYQAEGAWSWEQMALTRARVIAGPAEFGRRIEAVVAASLTRPRDGEKLRRDVADMRRRIEAEHRTRDPWSVKYVRGGLIDIEFIVQYLLLRYASHHPALLTPVTCEALARLTAAGLIDGAAAEELAAALSLWQAVQGLLRLTVGPVLGEASPDLRRLLARTTGMADFKALEARMQACRAAVLKHYRIIVTGAPTRAG